MSIVNTFFNFNDYGNPVNSYIDSQFFWDIAPGFRKKTDIYIRKDEANLQDDVIQLFTTRSLDFYSIVKSKESFELEDSTSGEIVDVFFRYDEDYDVYERRIYSFWDFLGQIGGLEQSLLIIGSFIWFLFTEKLYIASIIRRIYQIKATKVSDETTKIDKSDSKPEMFK